LLCFFVRKSIHQNKKRKMKITIKPILMAVIVIAAISVSSCKKNHEDNGNTNTVTTQIQTILPQKYIDSLTAHGLVLSNGKTPPVINGAYVFEPINDYDNSHIFSVGGAASDAKVKIANQSGNNAAVYIKGWVGIGVVDTSSAQVIAGAGNDFTVYAQAKGGSPVYTYDYVMTGTYSSAGIQNMKFAFVMIDNGGNSLAATTGTIRIFHDQDNIGSTTTTFRSMQAGVTNTTAGGAAK
jgi:hypothetical protein